MSCRITNISVLLIISGRHYGILYKGQLATSPKEFLKAFQWWLNNCLQYIQQRGQTSSNDRSLKYCSHDAHRNTPIFATFRWKDLATVMG